jgi:23S rRNA pseudouridine1911/1915/1917 synthase
MPEHSPGFQSRARRPPPEPEEIAINVVYEDDALIAIDKPPGMVVHPTYRNWSGTLLNGLLWHLRPSTDGRGALSPVEGRSRAGVQPSIITRLDKGTSGIVLAALTPAIHARVQRDGAAGQVRKEYLALVRGVPTPATGSIVLPLARSAEDRRRVVVTPAGQYCETRYEVLTTTSGYSLVRCELVTGRTHQIRVHLAARGWPIAGDVSYGEPHPALDRQALHAWRIRIAHPVTRIALTLEAPVPADLRALLDDPSRVV